MENVVEVCAGIAPEMWLPVGLLGALQDSHIYTQYVYIYSQSVTMENCN